MGSGGRWRDGSASLMDVDASCCTHIQGCCKHMQGECTICMTAWTWKDAMAAMAVGGVIQRLSFRPL